MAKSDWELGLDTLRGKHKHVALHRNRTSVLNTDTLMTGQKFKQDMQALRRLRRLSNPKRT